MTEMTERAPHADGADFLTGDLADQHLSRSVPLSWLSTAKGGEKKEKKEKPDKPVERDKPVKPVKQDDKDPHRASGRCP